MLMSKSIQNTMLQRIQQLTPEEIAVLKAEITPALGKVIGEKLLPELDMVFQSMGAEINPENVLGGEVAANAARGLPISVEEGALPPPGGPPPEGPVGALPPPPPQMM